MASKIISSHVYFYKNGMNKRNWAYNLTSHTAILAASLIGLDTGYTLARPLALGAPFELSPADYFTVKEATYIKIINQIQSGASVTSETRCAFIDSFTWLTVGTVTVNYTLDDWYNFFLSGDYSGASLDGFATQANIPLLTSDNKIDLSKSEGEYLGIAETETITDYGTPTSTEGLGGGTLPSDVVCYVIFYKNILHGSTEVDITALNYYYQDIDGEQVANSGRKIGFIICQKSDIGIRAIPMSLGRAAASINTDAGSIYFTDSNIEKVIEFNYFPIKDIACTVIGAVGARTKAEISAVEGSGYATFLAAAFLNAANLYESPTGKKYYSIWCAPFAPWSKRKIYNVYKNGDSFTKKTTYQEYISQSLYKLTNEFCKYNFIYQGAQIEISPKALNSGAEIICGVNSDGETVYINITDLLSGDYNQNAAFGDSAQKIIPASIVDYQVYRNAKITGALGIASSALGAVVGTVGGAAVGASKGGPVGAVAAGGTALIGGGLNLAGKIVQYKAIQKNQFNSSSNDNTEGKISGLENPILIQRRPGEWVADTVAKDLERNGAGCYIEINEYLFGCQMQSYNAIKTSDLDVHGIPDTAAQNIKSAFDNGVTLWTATNVGNKDVINYPLAQSIEL